MSIKSLDDIKNAFYINLEHRIDRKVHVESELRNIGIKAKRFNAINMSNGAIGCSMSHLKILEDGLKNNVDHILIVEDDIQFLDVNKFKNQMNKFLETHDDWDVVLLGGNNIPPFEYIDDSCVKVSRCQTTTGYLVGGHYINTLILNIRKGIMNLLYKPEKKNLYAIDIYWFNLQLVHKWYLITPLTVVQREDYSDIEKRITNYKNVMQDLDKSKWFGVL